MKKTEKIEIRLSHEDKERLNKIAENEGRTISQIVRGLIDKYMDLNSANPQNDRLRKPVVLATIFSGISGLILGALLVFTNPSILGKSQEPVSTHTPDNKSMNIVVKSDTVTELRFSMPLVDDYKTKQTIEYAADKSIVLNLDLSEKGHGMFSLDLKSCILENEVCVPNFDTQMDLNFSALAMKQIVDSEGNEVFIQAH